MNQTPLCPFVDVNVKCVVYCLQIDEDFKLNFDPDKPIIANKLAANYSEIIVLQLKSLQQFFSRSFPWKLLKYFFFSNLLFYFKHLWQDYKDCSQKMFRSNFMFLMVIGYDTWFWLFPQGVWLAAHIGPWLAAPNSWVEVQGVSRSRCFRNGFPRKKCFLLDFVQITTPQFRQLVQPFFDVKIQDLKVYTIYTQPKKQFKVQIIGNSTK